MSLSREKIMELASRYIHIDKADFPEKDDLFYFLARNVPENKVLKDNEGWVFSGYGQCSGYEPDHDSKPVGKWIYMYYLDLGAFPLREQVLKLQPPHIVQGTFSSPDRAVQFRIVKCKLEPPHNLDKESPGKNMDNILKFPARKI